MSRVKIAEFADAIGETSPLCRDRAAAQAAGYPDVIAPPTFAIVISMAAVADLAHEPDLGLNYAMVVHGLQSFSHARPLHAGDVVVAQSTIESVKPVGRMTTTDHRHRDPHRGRRAGVHGPVRPGRARRLGSDGRPHRTPGRARY